MYDRVLVPTDGSDGTVQAVVRALAVARTFDAEVHVLYVVDTRPFDGIDLADEEEFERVAIQTGRRAITAVRERADEVGLDVSQEVRTGVPHEEIVDYVEANDVDLVSMGTHGRTGAELGALGSTTERVLRRADVPVLTVQLTGGPDGTDGLVDVAHDDVLVPIDGSDPAVRAAEHAVGFAERTGATLHALYVVDTSIFEYEDAPRSILGTLREGGQKAVSGIEAMGADASVPTTGTVAEGRPFQAILDYARDVDADLVVSGRRGRTGLPEVLLGSTTARLVRLADAPVLSVT
ncbi:MAG TPA: universal stress protein [Halobacteriales archaeon]|nr:universal stress protein [Halobacteriales archaeon]